MAAAIVILSIVTVVLLIYLGILLRELRGISRQLEERADGNNRQPIHVEMVNRQVDGLVRNMNRCFKAEEKLRLNAIREEREFKEMIANISHDLRTPLTAVKGYLQLLGAGMTEKEQQEKLEIARKHTDHLASLVDEFFEYSYLLNVEQKIVTEKLNLTNLTLDCLASAVPLFEAADMEVIVGEADQVMIEADREKLVRIVQNLIRNSIMHADGNLYVDIRSRDMAEIHFRNPVHHAEKIDVNRLFDRFYTGDSSRNRSTGLGLSIVKILAEQMNGKAEVSLCENQIDIAVFIKKAD